MCIELLCSVSRVVYDVVADWCRAVVLLFVVFFQAEDGIRDLVRSRGLGDVYKRQVHLRALHRLPAAVQAHLGGQVGRRVEGVWQRAGRCLLYTSDAADERSSVDLGGRRIIKKKKDDSRPQSDVI